MYKENVDWSYMGINMPPGWCIEVLKGDYKGARIIFSDIQIQKEDGSVIAEDDDEDHEDLRMAFGYEVLEPHKELNHNDAFEAYVSDLMFWVIEEGLKDGKGTIQFYDAESEQSDIKITPEQ